MDLRRSATTMAGPPIPRPEDDKKIANADWLIDDTPKAKPKPKPAPTSPGRHAAGADHSYDVVGRHDEPSGSGEVPTPPVRTAPRPKKPRDEPRAAGASAPAPTATVDQVWSRGAEWGGNFTM